MPSKRHGYLTRKEWLAQRLEDARDCAGAFDVERLLRATRFYQTHTRYQYQVPKDIEARIAADIQAKGYSLQVGEATPLERVSRTSPPLMLYVPADSLDIEFPE